MFLIHFSCWRRCAVSPWFGLDHSQEFKAVMNLKSNALTASNSADSIGKKRFLKGVSK